MHVAACIFDAKTYQGPSVTIICQLARQLLVFFENHKISRAVVLGGPGGMRRGAGGDYEGVLRSARCDLQFRTCAFDSTRQLLPNGKGGGFNRSAHSAGPGNGPWAVSHGQRTMGNKHGAIGILQMA